MSPKKLAAFRLDIELIAGLEDVKRRTGAPVAEQVRRAITAWLDSHGVKVEAGQRRATTRKMAASRLRRKRSANE
jgi:predicted DNA-binding protein